MKYLCSDLNLISFVFFLSPQKHHSLTSRSWKEKHFSTSGASVCPSSPNGVKPSASDPALASVVSAPDMASFNITQQHEKFPPLCGATSALYVVLLFREPKGTVLKASSPSLLKSIATAVTSPAMDLIRPPRRHRPSSLLPVLQTSIKMRASWAPSKCLNQRRQQCEFPCSFSSKKACFTVTIDEFFSCMLPPVTRLVYNSFCRGTSNTTALDLTLKEAVEYLSHTEESYKQCGATFIQHASFKEEQAKQEV